MKTMNKLITKEMKADELNKVTGGAIYIEGMTYNIKCRTCGILETGLSYDDAIAHQGTHWMQRGDDSAHYCDIGYDKDRNSL